MGVDVGVRELSSLLPTEISGPFSTLAFILDRNGDVVFFDSLGGDADEYAERVKGLAEVDFIDIWPKRLEDEPRMKVRFGI